MGPILLRRIAFVYLPFVVACTGGAAPGDGPGVDASVPDAAPRDTSPTPDAVVAPDVTPDATPDATPDVALDVAPDVTPDVAPDVTPDLARTTTLRVRYPPTMSPVALRGSVRPLTWESGVQFRRVNDDTWEWTSTSLGEAL